MKYLTSLVLGCALVAGSVTARQGAPVNVSLSELIANPGKFEGKLVTVRGYLVAAWRGHDNHHTALLYLYSVDTGDLLDKAILVIPSKQMIRDEKKIDHMFVTLTGSFRAAPRQIVVSYPR